MSHKLKDFLPEKTKIKRKQISVDQETYDLIAAHAEREGLSMVATVKALTLFYERVHTPEIQ